MNKLLTFLDKSARMGLRFKWGNRVNLQHEVYYMNIIRVRSGCARTLYYMSGLTSFKVENEFNRCKIYE